MRKARLGEDSISPSLACIYANYDADTQLQGVCSQAISLKEVAVDIAQVRNHFL